MAKKLAEKAVTNSSVNDTKSEHNCDTWHDRRFGCFFFCEQKYNVVEKV